MPPILYVNRVNPVQVGNVNLVQAQISPAALSQADITSGSLEQVAVGADVDLSQLQVVQASALSAEQIDMDAFQAEISAKGLEGKTVVALQAPAQADIVQLAEVIADDKAATPGLKLGAL